MKTGLLCSLFLLGLRLASAQETNFPRDKKNNNRYWMLGPGLSFQSMYDEAVSYVRYNGTGFTPVIGLIKTSDRKYREFTLKPSFIKLRTDRSNDLRPMEVATTRFLLEYEYLVKMKEWSKDWQLYAGGSLSWLVNIKRAPQLDNSQLLYDYALSLGPAARVDKSIEWKKRACILSGQLQLPLISHMARPYYLNRIEFIDPKNDFVGDLFSNSSVATINNCFRITSEVSFTYPLFNRNALRLGYNWNFYKMRTINSVYAAEHLVSILFLSNY